MTDEELARLVAESRASQGLPPTVEDPTALARIAGLIVAAKQVTP